MAPGCRRSRRAVPKSQTLVTTELFYALSVILLVLSDVPLIQEVPGLCTSLSINTDQIKMALRARKVSGSFEERARIWEDSFQL